MIRNFVENGEEEPDRSTDTDFVEVVLWFRPASLVLARGCEVFLMRVPISTGKETLDG